LSSKLDRTVINEAPRDIEENGKLMRGKMGGVLKQSLGQRTWEFRKSIEMLSQPTHAEQHRVARLPNGSDLSPD
jgi:hypothetical protein